MDDEQSYYIVWVGHGQPGQCSATLQVRCYGFAKLWIKMFNKYVCFAPQISILYCYPGMQNVIFYTTRFWSENVYHKKCVILTTPNSQQFRVIITYP